MFRCVVLGLLFAAPLAASEPAPAPEPVAHSAIAVVEIQRRDGKQPHPAVRLRW